MSLASEFRDFAHKGNAMGRAVGKVIGLFGAIAAAGVGYMIGWSRAGAADGCISAVIFLTLYLLAWNKPP